jgi:hypothetical protein
MPTLVNTIPIPGKSLLGLRVLAPHDGNNDMRLTASGRTKSPYVGTPTHDRPSEDIPSWCCSIGIVTERGSYNRRVGRTAANARARGLPREPTRREAITIRNAAGRGEANNQRLAIRRARWLPHRDVGDYRLRQAAGGRLDPRDDGSDEGVRWKRSPSRLQCPGRSPSW